MNDEELDKKLINICKEDIDVPQSFTNIIKNGPSTEKKKWKFVEMKKVAVFLFAICIVAATSVGAYVVYKEKEEASKETKPQEILTTELVPQELDYEQVPVNKAQAEERAKDFLNRLGLKYEKITETELAGTEILSFWYINFDNLKYMVQINSKTGAIYNLSTGYMILDSDIGDKGMLEWTKYIDGVQKVINEYLETATKREGTYEERIPYEKDTIILKFNEGEYMGEDIEYHHNMSTEEAENYAKEIFMKIPLEKNTYVTKMSFNYNEWSAQFKTKIDGFETRYKEVIIRFKEDTKAIVGIELNPEDIYDNNEVTVSKEDIQNLMNEYSKTSKSKNTFEVKDIKPGISYVDPFAKGSFNEWFMISEKERIKLREKRLNDQLLLEKKLNDGDESKSPFEKWAEIHKGEKINQFFGGNVYRKVWFVEVKANEDFNGEGMNEDVRITIGIDASTKEIVYCYEGNGNEDMSSKPAKRSGGMAI